MSECVYVCFRARAFTPLFPPPESATLPHSHDSTTPLIGNGRILQGKQDVLLQQQYQQQQQAQQQAQPRGLMVDPVAGSVDPSFYHEGLGVEAGGGGGGGVGGVGGVGVGHYPQQGQQKVTFVPVYDYQHHHPPSQKQVGFINTVIFSFNNFECESCVSTSLCGSFFSLFNWNVNSKWL